VGVAGYLASLHGGADLDVRVDGHLDGPISYLSLGELRWLAYLAWRTRLYSSRDGIQLAARFHFATVIGGYSTDAI
jgi:hypothetical protein